MDLALNLHKVLKQDPGEEIVFRSQPGLLECLTMSASSEFRRVISRRSLLQPALLPITGSALVSGLTLALLMLLGSVLCWLLIEAPRQLSAGIDTGLLPLANELAGHLIGRIPANFIASFKPVQTSTGAAFAILVASVLCLVLRFGSLSLSGTLLEKHVAGAILRIRQHIHRKAIRLEPADLTGDQTRAADRLFQSATVSLESAAIQWGKLWLKVLPDLTAVLLILLIADWRLAFQTIIPVVIGWVALRAENRRGDTSVRLLSDQVDRGLKRMAESLKKTRIVTNFGMEQTEQLQFERHLRDYQQRCRLMHKQQRLGHILKNVILFSTVLVPGTILILHILNGKHPAIGILAVACLWIVYRSLRSIDRSTEFSAEGSETADAIAAYINRVPGVSQAPGAGFLQPMSKTLTFNQISFQTSQLTGLLRGLDLRIEAGETVALLSLQPAAARALASLIPRFVDPDLGQVLIDGRDIRQATLESLRAEAVFVSGQDPVFNASVLENITCSQPDITRQQALDAAKLVHADHFIRTLPRGYETELGEHGAVLDAGQIFRLSLARAIVRSPAILIIEEPGVAMDTETKALLDDAYHRIFVGRTVIFLPHRLSTVKKCSRIVLIHEGRIAVDGVHENLVRSSDVYRHWEYIRFNAFRDEYEPTERS